MTRAIVALLLLAAGAAAAGCSTSSAAPSEPVAKREEVTVKTMTVEARPVGQYLLLTGQLKSGRETDLAANANGKVTTTRVERGTRVKAGEVLATLDVRAAALNAAEAKANADRAETSAASSKLECDRVRALVTSGALGKAELERAEATCQTSDQAVSAAKARAQLAGQAVGDGVIRAPFDGVIAERYVDVGEFVRQDSKVVTLVDLDALRLELTVPETHIAAAQRGAKVTFTVSGYPDRSFDGELAFVGASVRSATRDVVAEATVKPEGAEVLRPGMFASLRLRTGEEPTPVVPKSAITTRDGKRAAFVVVNGRIEQRVVQTTEEVGDDVAVIRGLAAGESLVVAPSDELRNGQRASGG